MLIEFDKIPEKVIPNFKGGEKEFCVRMFDDGDNKIMKGRLAPGASIGLHTHSGNCEIVFVLSGEGKMLCDGVYEPLSAGSCTYCPNGHEHSLINDSSADLVFCAVVSEKIHKGE
ncbi:MAG: cupin domain-containing protein [Oscillospiraceae bacterium]|nr:cupin domain-containing protein [Oscillospiraceae bacterium]